jgi:REP element-mobilizing transposase RayT
MPAKHSQKYYVANSYYHIYNRGIDGRTIFQDEQDYTTFLGYLAEYLTPKDEKSLREKLDDTSLSASEKAKLTKQLRMNNFSEEITMLCYVLMPDHFHLFIKQKKRTAVHMFMNSLMTRYVMYFNRKYKRTGPLFQGVYKAVMVETDPYLLHLSAYIHRNPLSLHADITKQPSSYPEYLGVRQTSWVKPDEILSLSLKTNPTLSYDTFVLQTKDFSLITDEMIDTHEWIATENNQRPLPEKTEKKSFLQSLFGR